MVLRVQLCQCPPPTKIVNFVFTSLSGKLAVFWVRHVFGEVSDFPGRLLNRHG